MISPKFITNLVVFIIFLVAFTAVYSVGYFTGSSRCFGECNAHFQKEFKENCVLYEPEVFHSYNFSLLAGKLVISKNKSGEKQPEVTK